MLRLLPNSPGDSPLSLKQQRRLLFSAVLLVSVQPAFAKDVPVTGVLLYPEGGTLAYVQVSGFLINGKTELRSCSGSGPIEKSAYKNLAKLTLTSISELERLPDGSMVARSPNTPASCVVPGNFKWTKESALSPAELAEKSTYAGQVVGASAPTQTALPAFAPGVKFVLGSATDKEFAVFSLADRANSIPGWQAYLSQYPSSNHLVQANARFSVLLIKDGTENIERYKASRATATPAYGALKNARERADQVLAIQDTNQDAAKLRDAVVAEVKTLADTATAKLQAFRQARTTHSAGFSQLIAAKNISDQLTAIAPNYGPGAALASSVSVETISFDKTLQTANTQLSGKQYDAAYITISPYLSFADEEPRLKQVVLADYKYHFDKGNGEVTANAWPDAVADLKRASEINPDPECKAALVKAEAGLMDASNKAAAAKALATSKNLVEDKDIIGAYEALANLTDAQKLLVKDDMTALQDAYVQAASARANELQLAHTPIKGRADEDAVRQAYEYLLRASKLSDNPEISVKLEVMAQTISNYYVELAGKYLSKPLSSGVGLGWSYLTEASQYRPNLDLVRDAMTSNSSAYQIRSRLSLGVVFRDQTSRRDSAGFADQLQEAFATGLESSGLPVKIILPSSSNSVQPNFQVVGEILDHRSIRAPKKETLQSQYRSGSHEVPNDAWNKADQEFEGATLELQKYQSALTAAQAKNNKKMIETANKDLSASEVIVQQARAKMNAIPKTITQDVVSPYNYTKTTLEITNIVKLSFRLTDSSGNLIGAPVEITKGDQPKKFVILDNIKPDDTQGLKEIDTAPDETQLMTDVENDARDAMIKIAREKVQELPQKVLAQARARAANKDLEGAGEGYVLYLNCTPAALTPERAEAIRYLYDQFNIRNTANLQASAQ